MDYTEQRRFLARSRMGGAASGLILISLALVCLRIAAMRDGFVLAAIGITLLALAGSTYYTPDYLQLTVNPLKKSRWEIRVRWRVISAVVVIGMLAGLRQGGGLAVLLAVAWLIGANLLGRSAVPPRYFPIYFWATDFALLAALGLHTRCDLLLVTVLLAAAAHLSLVVCDGFPVAWAGFVGLSGCLLIFLSSARRGATVFPLRFAELFLASVAVNAWLVRRAQAHNRRNAGTALEELKDFTGYSAGRIQHLWSASDQELAANWRLASFDENDGEQMAEWYRNNSELYMFAISAYNLDYKRICANLRMLGLARGSCLDYGAGNGELILELARGGHRAAYYDVEGQSMKFARWRAERQSLAVDFPHSKEELRAAARQCGFDTIYSLDVLEHLPDLAGELDFLASLLSPGGLFIFNVPAGATQSHPMHLNHTLDARAHLRAQGLEEEPGLPSTIPFRKEETYLFRARAHRSGP